MQAKSKWKPIVTLSIVLSATSPLKAVADMGSLQEGSTVGENGGELFTSPSTNPDVSQGMIDFTNPRPPAYSPSGRALLRPGNQTPLVGSDLWPGSLQNGYAPDPPLLGDDLLQNMPGKTRNGNTRQNRREFAVPNPGFLPGHGNGEHRTGAGESP